LTTGAVADPAAVFSCAAATPIMAGAATADNAAPTTARRVQCMSIAVHSFEKRFANFPAC
jgi:hypothetical protein